MIHRSLLPSPCHGLGHSVEPPFQPRKSVHRLTLVLSKPTPSGHLFFRQPNGRGAPIYHAMDSAPLVPWPRVTAFVRQHTHDVRNHLNGIDLEAALLRELITDPEALEGVARLRQQVRDTAAGLRALSNRLADPVPRPSAISATELFEIWQEQ